ncbi:hypothetical protein J6590_094809 [Homalodisca vitripennis]|nr:hypothetical protein J6590_093520 [Homalodisca vitripennis]KAG8309075.1 hypothetical protein J6590_094809 [Homalodisca vitripennis]
MMHSSKGDKGSLGLASTKTNPITPESWNLSRTYTLTPHITNIISLSFSLALSPPLLPFTFICPFQSLHLPPSKDTLSTLNPTKLQHHDTNTLSKLPMNEHRFNN